MFPKVIPPHPHHNLETVTIDDGVNNQTQARSRLPKGFTLPSAQSGNMPNTITGKVTHSDQMIPRKTIVDNNAVRM